MELETWPTLEATGCALEDLTNEVRRSRCQPDEPQEPDTPSKRHSQESSTPMKMLHSFAPAERLHYVRGDATLASSGKGRKILAHVCNDRGKWDRGFVLSVSARWAGVDDEYRKWYRRGSGAGFRLGAVQFVQTSNSSLTVANMIGLHGTKSGGDGPPVRYDAIDAALVTVGARAEREGASIHMPRIAAGLAGGVWSLIEPLLLGTLSRHPALHLFVYDL